MSKKRISLPVFIVVVAFVIVITFQITFLCVTNIYREKLSDPAMADTKEGWEAKLEYIDGLVNSYFLKDIPKEDLEDYLPAAYMAALNDKYTYYLTKEEYEAFIANDNADMQGIGVGVIYNSEHNAIEVIGVYNGSPALEAGVQMGDLIYIVEGQSVAEVGYEESIDLMLGEAGTVANFSVLRENGEEYGSVDFSIVRGFIVEETVSYRLQGENVGIIRIDEFDAGTPKQFSDAIDALLGMGADRFVFDVRYNPGGNLEPITKILDMLLPEGPIIRIIDKNGKETVRTSDAKAFDYPIAVVTNGGTASAAELFTAALRDYEKAIVVGETTFGKGVMQSVIGLPDGSAIWMTTEKYCPPFSDGYDGVGITPDYVVSLPEECKNISIFKLTYEQDVQIKTAVELLCDNGAQEE